MTKIVKPMVDELKPRAKAGRPPIVRACPFCHMSMNATTMRQHLPQCERDHHSAPAPTER